MNIHNYYIYKIGQFLVSHISKKRAYKVAEYLASLHFKRSNQDRQSVVDNLKIITSSNDETEINYLALEVFKNFGRYLVDFLRSEEITKEYITGHIKLEGFQHLEEALNKGRGVIATTAHLGNWELSGIVTAILGYPLSVVAMVHQDKLVNDFFSATRRKAGIEVIPLGKAAKSCRRALNEHRIVALVGDREFGTGGIEVDFLGRKALVPKGPAFFSIKTGAPIIGGFLVREKEDNFRFVYEPCIEPVCTGNLEKDILIMVQKYIKVIERYIKQYPEQWLMFRRFWI